eukprot:m.208486 g.208486  ORF g.208486 m.208486 type:complete len:271 (+) comp18535_c3_seq1:654-1466(+)
MVTFRRFANDMPHVADLFNISTAAAYHIYRSHVKTVAYIFNCHQPWPTLQQAVDCVPGRTYINLGVGRGTAIFLGDCTEIVVPDSEYKPTHQCLYSQYKANCTCKVFVVTTPSSYICPMGEARPGACTDLEAAIADLLPEKLPEGSYLVYDRGIQNKDAFRAANITVITPSVAGKGQKVFSFQDGVTNRQIAIERINVERTMKALRNYAGFTCKKSLRTIGLASAESQVARGLCNLKIEQQDWVERSALSVIDDVVAAAGDSEAVEINFL